MSQPLKHIGWTLRFASLLVFVGAACLTRPVVTSSPNLKTNFTTAVHNLAVNKVDLLFMIDNSASMGDKQALLAAAIPDMVTRLVTPNCLDMNGNAVGPSDQTGACAAGTTIEFPPVHDMHIGIVSSSLGARGGNVCDPTTMNPANMNLNAHQDDRGELIARGGANEVNVPNAGTLNFLAWFPTVQANMGVMGPPVPAETTAGAAGQTGTLIGDFASMIQGVNEHGCGYEGQNESWYRFLVQPDPFQTLTVGTNNKAAVSGIDATILQQRAAFLRPDSLLAVIVVTDENEQLSNPNAVLQEAWLFDTFPFQGAPETSAGQPAGAPEGTAACGTFQNSPGPNPGPNDPACTWCAYNSVASSSTFATQCPADPPTGTNGYLDPSDDGILLRFWDEKQRFGVLARYPISRYVVGLTSPTVPDFNHETDGNGNYIGDQTANENCVNPIFAQNLPTDPTADLCKLTPGPRTPDLVFYAAIAGVPHELLQAAPGDPECAAGTAPADCAQKATLTDADWTKIIGTDPVNYDFTGMDFHMLESDVSRAGTSCPPGSDDTCDPINGREWDTGKKDLEYACIFPLVNPQTGVLQPKDCTLPQYSGACDCATGAFDNGAPLCQLVNGAYTQMQIAGKAYPSAREMEIAHAMATQGAGVQGIVSSLCPIHPSQVTGPTDPLYGYRPAVNAIVDRLKQALNVQCLPQQLTVDQATQSVPCLILVTLPTAGGESACQDLPGLAIPTVDVLSQFQATAHAAWLNEGGTSSGLPDPTTFPTCVLNELTPLTDNGADFMNGSCANSPNAGWCYVTGAAAGSCPQQILFTPGQPTPGAKVSLQCIEQTNSAVDGG
jgi:hypothetical protein